MGSKLRHDYDGIKRAVHKLLEDMDEPISAYDLYHLTGQHDFCLETFRQKVLKSASSPTIHIVMGIKGGRNMEFFASGPVVGDPIIKPIVQYFGSNEVKTVEPKPPKQEKWADAHIELVFRAKHRDLYADLEYAAEYNFRTLENEIMFRLFRGK